MNATNWQAAREHARQAEHHTNEADRVDHEWTIDQHLAAAQVEATKAVAYYLAEIANAIKTRG